MSEPPRPLFSPVIPIPGPELLERYDGRAPRYTSYPPVPVWTPEVGPAEYEVALKRASVSPEPFSLYVHLPFCVERCWYCGCNVQIARNSAAAEPYLDALAREMERVARDIGHRPVGALHLGGGTPNFLDVSQIRRLFSDLRRHFRLESASIDVELDPRHLSHEQLATFAEMGTRRISYGVQDLEPRVGAAIGRPMEKAPLAELIAEARRVGIEGVNVDILYGLPLQTPESMRRTVAALLESAPDRVALYGYAHVPWMRPQQKRLERAAVLPGAEARLGLFATAADAWLAAGYEALGMDHFALPADPLAAAARAGTMRRSFQGYTTVAYDDQVGLGVSAIGRVTGADGSQVWVQNTPVEKTYRDGAGLHTLRGHISTPDDQQRATLIESILCRLSVTSPDLWTRYPVVAQELAPFAVDGLIALRPDGMDVTPLGRHFLRPIAATFDAWRKTCATVAPQYSRAV